MNFPAIAAIYKFEMARWGRTFLQSIVSPVIATSLYFVVFGAAIGSRITEIEGVEYGVFIVPGLVMLTLLTQSVANASFGIYFPRFTGTIYELLSAPISAFEIVHRLCRGGRHKIGASRPRDPCHRLAVRAAQDRPSLLDDRLPGSDRHHLQPARLHHRALGRRLREAATRAAAHHHAADLSRRHVLLDLDPAAVLADRHAVQSRGVSRQRLPLELLRNRRCRARLSAFS